MTIQPYALPKPVQAAARRLLSAAIAVKVACELGEASEARRHAYDVLAALDELRGQDHEPSPLVERSVERPEKTQAPQQLSLPTT